MTEATIILFVFGAVCLSGALWSRSRRLATETTPDKEINVGITTADLLLSDGTIVKLSVPGFRKEEYAFSSSYSFNDVIHGQWITLDDGRMVNRDHVQVIFNIKRKDFCL